ncbi:hypothetical protein HOLleu_07088 [Holothuria leucospilota]|uniref:Uncharacterized protein n=1 Tax=Holothuria leucospilota TaxID=206669 RepID=A0A9Q1CH26_HOLLE|nr:hypothetical protein HOLleu_07088 [Holothuria leucospilota]
MASKILASATSGDLGCIKISDFLGTLRPRKPMVMALCLDSKWGSNFQSSDPKSRPAQLICPHRNVFYKKNQIKLYIFSQKLHILIAAIKPDKCHFRRSGTYSNLKFSWYAPRQPMVALRLDSKRESPPQNLQSSRAS